MVTVSKFARLLAPRLFAEGNGKAQAMAVIDQCDFLGHDFVPNKQSQMQPTFEIGIALFPFGG